jgi:hypothetical protein
MISDPLLTTHMLRRKGRSVGKKQMTTISTHHRALIAVFASGEEAIRAHSALLGSGIDLSDVAISADLTSDGIAAEAPGQAYENQGTAQNLWQLMKDGADINRDTEEARLLADVERGSVVLTVDPLRDSKRALVLSVLAEQSPVAIRGVRLRRTMCSWVRNKLFADTSLVVGENAQKA